MSLQGFQINPIDVSFHLQKSLEINLIQKGQGDESIPPHAN